ncbi:MAG: CehA/McbA family metallohydrolase [Clostridiaceae bacterium]
MKYTLKIEKSEERAYPRLDFFVPENAERIDVTVSYPRFTESVEDGFAVRRDPCVIDLALESPDGRLFGAAGSDRNHVFVSPLGSSAGFAADELLGGTWRVIAGAYHVPEGGVLISYEVEVTQKARRRFCGDTHVHTLASDGAFSMDMVAGLARNEGLDFLFITDHNNVSAPPVFEGVTVLPGVEWTHYQGHAGFLGSPAPLPGRYDKRNVAEARALMQSARDSGAMVALNHPFCPLVPWLWGFEVPFDALEVWNGVMSERNERAVAYWQGELCAGKRIPAIGGSDYHRPGLLGSLATPCMNVYAPSRSRADILNALKTGDGFISYLPHGPTADVLCQNADGAVSFGGSAPKGTQVTFVFDRLSGGDEIRLITDAETERIPCPEGAASYQVTRAYPNAKFVRAELSRVYAPGLPPMKALLTNPIYFD